MKNKGGAPTKYNKEFIEDITDKLETYIASCGHLKKKVPVLAEFAVENNIYRQRLYEWAQQNERLSDAIKICRDKKEATVEILGYMGVINPTMAVFSLKQLGWRDKQEVEHSGEMNLDIKIDYGD